MKKERKITFESLTPAVKTALGLLKKKKSKAKLGVGSHHIHRCPIAQAYDIEAHSVWDNLPRKYRDILKKEGWNGRLYRRFINWYDGFYASIAIVQKRELFLKEFLK